MRKISTFSALREAQGRHGSQERAEKEPESWPMRDSHPSEYYRSFEPFMRGSRSLEAFVQSRKEAGLENTVLDLASDGGAFTRFREGQHDGALAVGLSDPRKDATSTERYNKANVDVVSGSLISNKTWDGISKWTHDHGKTGFDLVFFRPGAGIKYIGVETDQPEDGSYAILLE